MSGRHRLRAGAPRLLGRHDGRRGRWFGEGWRAVRAEFGELGGLARLEAGRVCVAWVQFRTATEDLEQARRQREAGRGRRPSARLLERLARRQGLADTTYAQAVEKLRALVASNGHAKTPSLADYLAKRTAP
jgi:hypothetical protein